MHTRLFITICVLLSAVIPGNAQKRTFAEAEKMAEDFFKAKGNSTTAVLLQADNAKDGRSIIRKAPAESTGAEAYWLFTDAGSKQLVIVSGDERMQGILGYTDSKLAGDALPEGLTLLLDGYKAQYNALPAAAQAPSHSALHKGERLLKTAEWGQWAPFNQLTPLSYPTGCAATAMTIVMRYHKWPLNGAGSTTHIWKDSVMTADFGHTRYDWDNMPLSYESYTTEQAKAVALLMRHAGISVKMNYAPESSGAPQSLVPGALTQHFRYAATTRLVSAADYDAATWDNMMRHEIDADRPVIYTGDSRMGRGAHGFVLDGYRDNLFHFNFGWNGSGNGYFAISALASTSKAFEFANNQQAVIGIAPVKEDNAAPLTLECQGTYEGFYTTLTTLTPGSRTDIHLSALTALRDWKGKMQWQLCHADGSGVEVFGSQTVALDGGSTKALDFEINPTVEAVEGDYLQLMACEEGATQWRPVLNAKGKEVVAQAHGRKVPVVSIVSDTKNATLNDDFADNRKYEGKPLLGSEYRYEAAFGKGMEKTIVQERLCGGTYNRHADGTITLYTDTLYIKAKGYTQSQLVAECNVTVGKEGQLQDALLLATPDADAVETLNISGELNDNDLQYLSTLQSLKALDFENSTTKQGIFGAPFNGFSRLTSCKLPRSLKQMGSETFRNCRALKSISLPVSLQATGGRLFDGCQALTDIYVYPASPECVAADAFDNLPVPTNVTIHVQQDLADKFRSNAKWSMFTKFVDDLPALPKTFIHENVEYNAIYDGDGNYAEVAIPSDGNMYTGDITIPATISYQGIDYTVRGFAATDGLSPFVGNMFVTSLDLQLHVDSLRSYLFMGCTNLASLKLPPTLRYIGPECFRNCPMLMQITLPASIEELGDNAFCGCQYLTDIYCHAMTPPTGSDGDSYPFAQCRPQNVTVHVPEGCENLYRTSGFWSRFSNIVADLPSGITETATPHCDTFPLKVAGRQWLTLRLDKPQRISIYSLNGTPQRTVLLPEGESSIRIEKPCVLTARPM